MTCTGCGDPMRLDHPSGYHPTCDPSARSSATCSRCGARMRAVTDTGLCGWCHSGRR